MAIPSGFLDELKTRISIVEVIGRRVSWNAHKSIPAKGDYWACCPFHGEKTPSFHVVERDGFYKCFGCGESGSVFDFVMKVDNLSFPEAVEQLAADAGMQMPERDERARERAAKQAPLTELMSQAADFFRESLNGAAGRDAMAYLARRGVSAEMIERFGLGYAPNARDALSRRLLERGARPDALVEANLAVQPDGGGAPYDRFRDRLMFPITDPRGRIIAFGGRAMSDGDWAKYLNSSETPLFSKGRVLYNFRDARAAAGHGGGHGGGHGRPLIVVEGYMDVVALVQHGFEAAVAPLGTALTEDQLALLWKASDEPVIALDGDEAGLRAAHRAADLALSRLSPGKSLNFALLPEGLDPDDMIRNQGAEAFGALIAEPVPLVELLWRREIAGNSLDTPERRAAFDARLRELCRIIDDPSVRRHYELAFRDRRRERFEPGPPQRDGRSGDGWRPGRDGRRAPPIRPAPGTKTTPLSRLIGGDAQGDSDVRRRLEARWRAQEQAERICEAVLLLGVLNHPWLADSQQASLDTLEFSCPRLDSIRGAILSALAEVEPLDAAESSDQLLAQVDAAVGAEAIRYLRAEGGAKLPRDLAKSSPRRLVETAYLDILRAYGSKVMRRRESKEYVTEHVLGDVVQSEDSGLERFGSGVHEFALGGAWDDDIGGGTDTDDALRRLEMFAKGLDPAAGPEAEAAETDAVETRRRN